MGECSSSVATCWTTSDDEDLSGLGSLMQLDVNQCSKTDVLWTHCDFDGHVC